MIDSDALIFTTNLLAADGSLPGLAGLRIFGFFIFSVGLLSLIRPQVFWYLRVGRKIPGVPAPKIYLLVLRFGAILVIALGLFMMFGLNT